MAEIILPPEENEETPETPELDIDKPTENSKIITIEFEAKKTNKVSTKDTNQQLYTTDTDAWFEFKETSLEGANGTYSVVFRNRHDGSIFQRTGDVVNGVAYYKIPHQEIRHAGAWRGQIVYTLSNGDTTAREFDYDVKGHILDGKDVREIVVEDFETLMSQLRNMKDNAEVELANLVNTTEQNETNRQVFFNDLVEDIDDLQANYQELLDTGVLQTNINTKLEQLEEEYAPKLTEVTAQLAETVADAKIGRGSVVGNANIVLDIPTYDGSQSVTHPDVIYISEGWNGYTHWMAYTPYPDGGRENPCIAASNNGVDWVTPEGLVNPIKTYQEARDLGYNYWSDTDLVLMPDNRLAIYFRGNNSSVESIYRMTSDDGVNWGEFTLVIEKNSSNGQTVLSPSVIVEDDGSFSMFSVNSLASNVEKLERRTSSDGINWNAPETCTIPSGFSSWHVNGVKVNGIYHLLVASDYAGGKGRLYYLTSSDGLNFNGDNKPAIPLSGYPQDNMGHYRSSLVPIPGNPLAFKVYVATWRPSLNHLSDQWRILYYDNVVFENNTFRSSKKIDVVVQEHSRVFIPANDFIATAGQPTKSLVGIGNFYWRIESVSDQIVAPVNIPKDWKFVRTFVLCAKLSGESGPSRFLLDVAFLKPADDVTSYNRVNRTGMGLNNITLDMDNIVKKGFLWTNSVPANYSDSDDVVSFVRIMRAPDPDTNTLDRDVAILGVYLEKAESAANTSSDY